MSDTKLQGKYQTQRSVRNWVKNENKNTHASAFVCVKVPSCPAGFLWGSCASASVRGLLSLAFCSVHLCTCASAYFELALVNLCSQQSSVVHRGVGLLCLLSHHSTFERSLLVMPPYPPLFPLYIIALWQVPFFPSAWELVAGLPGFESPWSILI